MQTILGRLKVKWIEPNEDEKKDIEVEIERRIKELRNRPEMTHAEVKADLEKLLNSPQFLKQLEEIIYDFIRKLRKEKRELLSQKGSEEAEGENDDSDDDGKLKDRIEPNDPDDLLRESKRIERRKKKEKEADLYI